MTSRLRIATRKSQLALWQAEHVSALLRAAHPGLEIELVPLLTQGDRIQDRTLAAIGGKGLFIKELEVALEDLRADIAVHSMKDVPADLPHGLIIGAVLKRADPRDALVTTSGVARLEDLPHGGVVGTSSLRRQAQIRALRPDLRIESLRGNVDTRLRKLDAGQESAGAAAGGAASGKRMDAIVLACAGLIRLGQESRITARLDPKICLPAVTQGVIGIECRQNDSATVEFLRALEDRDHAQSDGCGARFRGTSWRQLSVAHCGLRGVGGGSNKPSRTGCRARWLAAAERQPVGQCGKSGGAGAPVGGAHLELRRGPAARAPARRLTLECRETSNAAAPGTRCTRDEA